MRCACAVLCWELDHKASLYPVQIAATYLRTHTSLYVCVSHLPHVCVPVKHMYIACLPYAYRYEHTSLMHVDITHVYRYLPHTSHSYIPLPLSLPFSPPFSLLLSLSTPPLLSPSLSETHTQTRMCTCMDLLPVCLSLGEDQLPTLCSVILPLCSTFLPREEGSQWPLR